MLHTKFTSNEATRWGLSQARETSSQYVQLYNGKNSTDHLRYLLTLSDIISVAHSWLVATPGGFVNGLQGTPAEGLIEFKNPHSYHDLTLIDAVQNKTVTFFSCTPNGLIALKHSDKYYCQLQVAMYCTEMKWCDFVVSTCQDVHIEWVYMMKFSAIPSCRH